MIFSDEKLSTDSTRKFSLILFQQSSMRKSKNKIFLALSKTLKKKEFPVPTIRNRKS